MAITTTPNANNNVNIRRTLRYICLIVGVIVISLSNLVKNVRLPFLQLLRIEEEKDIAAVVVGGGGGGVMSNSTSAPLLKITEDKSEEGNKKKNTNHKNQSSSPTTTNQQQQQQHNLSTTAESKPLKPPPPPEVSTVVDGGSKSHNHVGGGDELNHQNQTDTGETESHQSHTTTTSTTDTTSIITTTNMPRSPPPTTTTTTEWKGVADTSQNMGSPRAELDNHNDTDTTITSTTLPYSSNYKWNQSLGESQISTGLLRYEDNFFSTTKTRIKRNPDKANNSFIIITNTTSTIMNTTTSIYDKLSILPLLPWEYETIGNPTISKRGGTWEPPPHSHKTCAIGSISGGGNVDVNPGCATSETYEDVYETIIQTDQFSQFEQEETTRGGGICDVCHMLDILATTGQRLVFWGDSLQRQSFDGLLCEIQRRHYRIIYQEVMEGRAGVFHVSDLTTVLIELPPPLVPQTRSSTSGDYDNVTNNTKGETTTATAPPAQPQRQERQQHRYVTVQYLAQYRTAENAQQIYEESLVPYLFNETLYTNDQRLHHVTQQPVIYLLSFGLHFPMQRIETYTRRVKATIEAIQFHAQPQKDDDNDQGSHSSSSSSSALPVLPGPPSLSSSTNRILWRETTSQHFNSSLGFYGENRGTHCFPIRTSNYTYHPDWGWHERKVVDKIAIDDGWKIVPPSAPSNNDHDNNNNNHPKMQKLLIKIPFRDFSALFHRLHSGGECTHFCSTPHFWNYQWRHIRMAMETYFL